jgi:hypothetical protein
MHVVTTDLDKPDVSIFRVELSTVFTFLHP